MDYIELEKLKWHSRRSILELDLYFDRFLQANGLAQLSEAELAAYRDLLEYDDNEILSFFWGRDKAEDKILQQLIDKIIANG